MRYEVEKLSLIASGDSRFDYVVVQGYQPWSTLKFKTCMFGYMPHSPVPAAEELLALGASRTEVQRVREEEAKLLERSRHVFFPCHEAAEPYFREFSDIAIKEKAQFIPSGLPLYAGAKPTQRDRSDLQVVYAGRYVQHKGYDLFLKAAEKLSPDYPQVTFHTMGSGPSRRVSPVVRDHGWVADPAPIFQRAALIVVPNRVAYFDLTPLEAAAAGLGMVLTRVGGNIEQLRRFPSSVSCSTDEVAVGISTALSRLETDPTWGAANQHAFNAHYSARPFARRWVASLRQIVP